MSEFKGTEDNWIVGRNTEGGVLISKLTEEYRDIATVWRYSDDYLEKQEAEANAKLIACAPLMLEMLEKVYEKLECGSLGYDIQELIKKATE